MVCAALDSRMNKGNVAQSIIVRQCPMLQVHMNAISKSGSKSLKTRKVRKDTNDFTIV